MLCTAAPYFWRNVSGDTDYLVARIQTLQTLKAVRRVIFYYGVKTFCYLALCLSSVGVAEQKYDLPPRPPELGGTKFF
ncbi:hypothetical protein Glo7428_0827 [Gloeocapsa sp. PCC 7428]|uniref:hypothetical protein n=1 Tax=Gloeocapsa sp. PCC 7428 TaxID=1173026 RepID=UPI0002A6085F|nr:hypothetical protein [Gloeocapsa sp. PCC 7428]AFZ29410.1 hypothetical protein Glo7428_0827 [Gloeocapsa sp. PCC 7428]